MTDKELHIENRIRAIRDKWFLIDPGFFMVICTHVVELNPGIGCAIACGDGHIYINPVQFIDKSDIFLEDALKLECIRILLKHPYQRQLPNRVKNYLSSNMVIANNYSFREMKVLTSREFFGSYQFDKENLEMIYDNIKLPESKDSQEFCVSGDSTEEQKQSIESKSNAKGNKSKNKQASAQDSVNAGGLNKTDDACSSMEDAFNRTQFWKEDDLKVVEMNKIINKISDTNSWGSMPGDMVDVIKKSLESRFNYKALFQQFRSTVISSSRTRTRMKPNRRFNYDAMGSKRNFTTKLLVAVDTSGSISDDDLSVVFDFINKFFKYGIDTIDTIQFDCEISENSLQKLSKRMNHYNVRGRGGTDFNCVFKYVQGDKHFYDGVIIVTDGMANVPDSTWLKNNYKNTRYLWCLSCERRWKMFLNSGNIEKFKKFGGVTYVDRPDASGK